MVAGGDSDVLSMGEMMAQVEREAERELPPPPSDFAPRADSRTYTGTLIDGDLVVPDDESLYDVYEVDLRAGWRVSIEMRSEDFDAYLWLIGPDGVSLAQDDDGGEGVNSVIRWAVRHDGRYVVRANSFDGSGRGAYQVTISVER